MITYKECWYRDTCNLFPDRCGPTCLRFAEMRNLMKLSNLPEATWKPVLLTANEDRAAFLELKRIKDDIQNWVIEGNNLYIYSENFGNGKTTWAIKLMLAYFNRIWAGNAFKRRGIFITMPEFQDRNREVVGNRDDEFAQMRKDLFTCDLVIWDDVTSTKLNDFAHSMFLNYLDARILAKKANIFTGNCTEDVMETFLGGRLTSRIWGISHRIHFDSPDQRGID